MERYRNGANSISHWVTNVILKDLYYFLRPFAPCSIRTMVQRMYYRHWDTIPFPGWPVDLTVDHLLQHLLALLLQTTHEESIPFIWFWPDGCSSCAVMTHDVETQVGLEFCSALMDIDDSWGIKSSFQLVPEERYRIPETLLREIRMRGFEINIHDLNHDGSSFRDHETFLSRVAKINEYAKAYGAAGFRSAAMYRQPQWFGDLNFSYDMSIPNSAHMEPQRGGCCTVMPFFVDGVLELPLTTIQDWALFNVLREGATTLWIRQMDIIASVNGMATFITHPDYLTSSRAQNVYLQLLNDLTKGRSERNLWTALPAEVNQWWRDRAQMKVTRNRGQWTISGSGSERAQIAYACIDEGKLCYRVGPATYFQSPGLTDLHPEGALR
jgi:hypothetical protein